MHNGFIVIDRKMLEWKYHDNPLAFALWIHVLLKANWKDGWFHGRLVERGSFITSVGALAKETGIHTNTVRKYLKQFEKDEQILLNPTNKFTLITVINYAKYQDLPDDLVQQDVQQDVQQLVHNRTKKQRNNNKKEKYTKRKDVLPAYMTDSEFDEKYGNSTALGISELEEIRTFIDSE